MKNIFTKNSPVNYLLILLIGIAVWSLHFMIMPFPISSPQKHIFLYKILHIETLNSYLNTGIAFIMFYLLAIYLIIINQRHLYVDNAYQLPGIILMVLSGLSFTTQTISPGLIAAFFILAATNSLSPIYRKPQILNNCFNAGFILAIGSMFYIHTIWFLGFLFIIILIIRPFNWREYASTTMGYITPIIIVVTVAYLLNKHNIIFENIIHYFPPKYSFEKYRSYHIISFAPTIIMGILFGLYQISHRGQRKIISHKYLNIIVIMMLLSIIGIIFPFDSFNAFAIFVVPMSLLMSFFLLNNRNKIYRNIITILLVLNIVFAQAIQLFYFFAQPN
jgi:hypothetical protein